MLKRTFIFPLFCWLVGFTTYGQSSDEKSKSLTLFSIGKKPVTVEEFTYLYRKNHQEKSGEFTKEKVEEYLNLFINFKLKVEEAKHRGLDTTQAFRKEYGTYREELKKPYLPDSRMIDSLAELTYERMTQEVRASHLLINVTPEASPQDTLKAYQKVIELRERILKGEAFEEIASTYSEDPTARMNKGDLGYFTAMQMVFPFEQAVYTTAVGQLSMPVRTRFGYHLIKVTDKRPASGEVEVSHIMIRTGEGQDNEQAKNQIFEVYEKLQKGVRWEEVCKEYSQDPSSKDNGGRLRPFGVGAMGGVPEFEQVAFDLKKAGDVSDPFQTQFGWHIIRLESKIPLPPYKEIEASLKSRISRDERSQISRQALQQKMRREFSFTELADTKAQIITMADSSLISAKWKIISGPSDGFQTLFSVLGKNYSVREFLSFVERNQKQSTLSPDKYMLQLYDQFVEETIGQALEEKIKKQNPDYNWLLKEYYEGILLFEIMEKEVWNKASEDSVGQKKYYDENKLSYQAKERIKGKIFSGASREVLEQLKTLIEKEDSIKVHQFVVSNKIRQETGAFEKTDRPVLAKISWSTGLHLSENNGSQYLVWAKNILPPGTRTFDEARPSVISDYQNYLEKRWIDQLKKKYPVKVSKKGKQYVLEQLVKS